MSITLDHYGVGVCGWIQGHCGLDRTIGYGPMKWGHLKGLVMTPWGKLGGSNSCTRGLRHYLDGSSDQSSGYRTLYALSERCEDGCYV